MGLDRSPYPFLYLVRNGTEYFRTQIFKGVNFASWGSGVLNDIGIRRFGKVICLQDQVEQFEQVRGNITEILGPAEAARYVTKALFVISVGTNDLFDYRSGDLGIILGKDEFMAFLIQHNYYAHIKKLYDLGARKFGIVSVPPIGCSPAARADYYAKGKGGRKGCVKELNDLTRAFFSQTESLLQRMSSELKGIKFSLANTYAMTLNILQDPLVFGLKDTNTACCGSGKFNGKAPCVQGNETNLCGNRRDHLFWDWYHPTVKVSGLVVLSLFCGGPNHVTPMNFSQLALIEVDDMIESYNKLTS